MTLVAGSPVPTFEVAFRALRALNEASEGTAAHRGDMERATAARTAWICTRQVASHRSAIPTDGSCALAARTQPLTACPSKHRCCRATRPPAAWVKESRSRANLERTSLCGSPGGLGCSA